MRTQKHKHAQKRKTELKDLAPSARIVIPIRFPDDPVPVKLLIEESERVSKLGNDWLTAKVPNHIAAEVALRNGWAFSLAAVLLRCKLKGELKPDGKAT